jgi:hypothetical protein
MMGLSTGSKPNTMSNMRSKLAKAVMSEHLCR